MVAKDLRKKKQKKTKKTWQVQSIVPGTSAQCRDINPAIEFATNTESTTRHASAAMLGPSEEKSNVLTQGAAAKAANVLKQASNNLLLKDKVGLDM